MYRQVLSLSVGLWLITPSARPQTVSPTLTVDQLVEAARARNRDYLSTLQRIREAQGLLKQAAVGVADSVEISALAGQAFGNSGEDNLTATYSHTFETFGKRGRRIAVAQKEVSLAEANSDERRRTLIFDVKTRYADAATEQQKLAVIDRLSKINQDYLRLTEARAQKGDVARLEADLLRVELSRDQSRRALTEGRVRSALLQLEAMLGVETTGGISVTSSLVTPSFKDDLQLLKERALRNRPDLRWLQLSVQQAESQVSLARVESKPNLTVSGQYSHADAAFDQFARTPSGALAPIQDHVNSLGVGLSIPLTTSRRNLGNVEAAVARQSGAQMRREYLSSVISAQVEAAYQRWKSAQRATDIFTQGVVGPSERNLEVMRQAYTLGELRLIDILTEQRRLLDTELTYIDTQADLFRAHAELEQAVGGSLQ